MAYPIVRRSVSRMVRSSIHSLHRVFLDGLVRLASAPCTEPDQPASWVSGQSVANSVWRVFGQADKNVVNALTLLSPVRERAGADYLLLLLRAGPAAGFEPHPRARRIVCRNVIQQQGVLAGDREEARCESSDGYWPPRAA